MTTLPVSDPRAPEDAPRRLSRRATGADAAFVNGSRVVGASVLVITGGVGVFLALQTIPTFRRYGIDFLLGEKWEPNNDIIGIAGVLVGTICIATVAISMAFPLALLTALYISEYAPARIKGFLVSLVDLMAAVPSIVWGLWGYFLVMPYAADFAHFLHKNLGWIPIFDVRGSDPDAAVWPAGQYTGSAFCAAIAVAMMVLPMACAVVRQVFLQTSPGERVAALALAATRWGVVTSVVLPFGRGGIIGGTMLGLGRALGETIAVALIIVPAFEVKFRAREVGTNSVSALIAVQFGEASPSQLSALLAAGFVLFMLTLVVNTLAAMVVNRSRSGADADA